MLIFWLLIIPMVTAGICVFIPRHSVSKYVSIAGSFITFVYNIVLNCIAYKYHTLQGFDGFFYLDSLSILSTQIVSLVGFAAALYSAGYMEEELHDGEFSEKRLRWYYFLFHMFIFTMLSVCVTNNLGIMWVAIEATTLATTFLVGFYNKKPHHEAAWKYIIICTVGITLALFGVILTYHSAKGALGDIGYALNWSELLKEADRFEPHLIRLAFLFILVGYGTKAGLAPMHTWLPDAHSQAPSPISALFSGVLMIFGFISILVSVPFIIVQKDFKRLLAFRSIEHTGIIALGFGFGGMYGVYGAELHAFSHAVVKSLLFFCAGNFFLKYKTRDMDNIKGAIKIIPVTGVMFLIGIFAITGTPPFNIFLSEFLILADGFSSGRPLAIIFCSLVTIALVLIFVGFVYNMFKMIFGSSEPIPERGEGSKFTIVAMGFLLFFVLVVSIYVPPFLNKILQDIYNIVRNA